jgi:hypothetical protein
MFRTWLAATTALAMMTGVAAAQTPSVVGTTGSQSPGVGAPIMSSRGSEVVTGVIGSTATTTIPGSGGQGLLMSNGNGTSMMTVPGQPPDAIAIPK